MTYTTHIDNNIILYDNNTQFVLQQVNDDAIHGGCEG
jgi:hypothetical protein